MITSEQLTTTAITQVFTASTTGAPIGGAVTGQTTAVTTIVLCNTGTVDITDESVDIYLVRAGVSPSAINHIVSNLTIPAGETVFFSDEKIILDAGDEIHVKADDANLITVTVSSLPV
jgi:hypothetical protein